MLWTVDLNQWNQDLNQGWWPQYPYVHYNTCYLFLLYHDKYFYNELCTDVYRCVHVCIHFYEYFSLICNFWCLRAKFLLIILTYTKRLQSISRGPEVLNIAIYHLDNDKEFSSSVVLLDFCLFNARSASLWFCSAVLAPRCQWSPCFQLSESFRALEKNPW